MAKILGKKGFEKYDELLRGRIKKDEFVTAEQIDELFPVVNPEPVIINGIKMVPWSTGTDEEIAAIIDGYYNRDIYSEDIKDVWHVGDCRNINISAINASGRYNNNTWLVGESHRAQTVQLQILDFNHDILTAMDGMYDKALMTVQLKDCLRDANVSDNDGLHNTEHGAIHSYSSYNNGWEYCARRKWCNYGFYQSLPNYLMSRVRLVNKLTSATAGSTTMFTSSDYCFLLSEEEVFGTYYDTIIGEGYQYSYFKLTPETKYKLPRFHEDACTDMWWLRSRNKFDSSYFCTVSYSGSGAVPASENVTNSAGIAPAFCL